MTHSTFFGHGRQSLIVCELERVSVTSFGDHCRSEAPLWETTGQGALGNSGKVLIQRREDVVSGWKAQFRADEPDFLGPASVLGQLSTVLREDMKNAAQRHGVLLEAWLRGVILGEQAELPGYVAQAFKRTGLYHLIVVSGSHVSFAALCVSVIVLMPWQLAYALRWVTPEAWVQLRAVMVTLAMTSAWLYAVLVGLPQSAQRALLGFLVFQASPMFFGTPSGAQRLLITGLMQGLIYPLGFASVSTLLSWGACLIVISGASDFRGTLTRRLSALVAIQVRLTVLLAAVTGQLCLGGIVINLIVLPVFPLVFLASAFLLLPIGVLYPLTEMAVGLIENFISFVIEIDELGARWSWFVVDLTKGWLWLRLLLMGVTGVVILNALAKLSINQRGVSGPTNAPIWESL